MTIKRASELVQEATDLIRENNRRFEDELLKGNIELAEMHYDRNKAIAKKAMSFANDTGINISHEIHAFMVEA